MYFTRLSLKNVRAIEHLDLEFPACGVTLIEGDNEAGKSTIVDALDAWQSFSYTSNAAQVKSLRPIGRDVSPEVSVGIHIGEYEFELSKRWFGGKKAELVVSEPQTMRLTGKDAEAWVKKILASQAESVSFDALTIRQGGGFDVFDAASIPAVTSSLGQDYGEVTGITDSATGVLRAIAEEYEKYFTSGRGNPTGAYKKALEEFDSAKQGLAQAEQAAGKYRETLDRLTSRHNQLEEARNQYPAYCTRLQEAEEQYAKVEQSKTVLRESVQALKVSTLEKESVQKQVEYRAELVAKALQADQAIAAAEQAFNELSLSLREVESEKAKLDEQSVELRDNKSKLAKALSQTSDHVAWGQLVEKKAALESAVESADLARSRKDNAARGISEQGVIGPEELAEIQQAAMGVETAEKVVAATVGTITISGPHGEETFSLDQSREWTLGEYLVSVEPGTSRQDIAVRLEEARSRLTELLARNHVDDLDTAHRGHKKWAELKEQVDDAVREELVALQGRTRSDLESELESVTRQIKEIREKWEGEIDFESALPSRDRETELKQDLAATEQKLQEVDNQRLSLQERLDHSGIIEAKVKLEQAKEQASLLGEQLDNERAEKSDLELQKLLAAAEMKMNSIQESHEHTQNQHNELDPESVERELGQAKTALDNTASYIQELTTEVSRLEGSVQAQASSEELVQQALQRFESAQQSLVSIERRAEAARRLKEVVDVHFVRAQRLYAKPYLDALKRTSRIVFGNSVEYQSDENNPLAIQKRVLNGIDVSTHQLSGGAKEQLGILQRIAVAEIVGTVGVPLILDDALGYADARRISRMNAVLSDAAKRHQIIVLTCVPQRYAELSAQKRYPM